MEGQALAGGDIWEREGILSVEGVADAREERGRERGAGVEARGEEEPVGGAWGGELGCGLLDEEGIDLECCRGVGNGDVPAARVQQIAERSLQVRERDHESPRVAELAGGNHAPDLQLVYKIRNISAQTLIPL